VWAVADERDQNEQFDSLRVPLEGRLGFRSQDENAADGGDHRHHQERQEVQGTSVFDRDRDGVQQLCDDEEQEGLLEDHDHDRLQVLPVGQRGGDVTPGVDDDSPGIGSSWAGVRADPVG
jgi:hypothetical protein